MARTTAFGAWGLSGLFYLVAVVIFLLAGFGVDFGDFDRLDLLALGLASFTAAHVV